MFCTARRFQQHSALAVRYKGTGSRGRCLSVTEGGLTQIFVCSTLTSAQQGFLSLVWITLFMRISLLVINACALYKSGFKFLSETRLWKHCQMIFLPRQRVPFSMENGNALLVAKDPSMVQIIILFTSTSFFVPVRGKNTLFKLWTVHSYHKLGRHCPPKWPVQMIHQTSYWIPQQELWTEHLLLPRLCWSQSSDLPAPTWEQAVDKLELLQSDLTRYVLFFPLPAVWSQFLLPFRKENVLRRHLFNS